MCSDIFRIYSSNLNSPCWHFPTILLATHYPLREMYLRTKGNIQIYNNSAFYSLQVHEHTGRHVSSSNTWVICIRCRWPLFRWLRSGNGVYL